MLSCRLCQASNCHFFWGRTVHQWEACVLWRLHLLWAHYDSYHGIPGHQTMWVEFYLSASDSQLVTRISLMLFFVDSPKRFKLLHWASFLVSLSGVVFLLLGRGHYTIDVVLAYFVSTRIWWTYHTLAHNKHLRKQGEDNMLANECWWLAFRYVLIHLSILTFQFLSMF